MSVNIVDLYQTMQVLVRFVQNSLHLPEAKFGICGTGVGSLQFNLRYCQLWLSCKKHSFIVREPNALPIAMYPIKGWSS